MKHDYFFIACVMSLTCGAHPATADDRVINDQHGNEFMEEEAPKVKAPPPGRKLVPRIIDTSSGPALMQEVVPDNDPLTRPYHAPDDYSNVGVPTDKSGNIVPLIQQGAPPVMELGGHLQAPLPTFGYPYRPYVSPYGYPPMYGQPSALHLQLGGVNIGIGSSYPGFAGPIGVPYAPVTTPFGYGGNMFGIPANSTFSSTSITSPLGGSYNNNSTFGPTTIQSSGSWRSF